MRKKKMKKEEEMTSLLQEEYNELQEKARERDEYYNKWLGVHAEYENIRRRIEKEKENLRKFANEDIISTLFPIVDNFDMALDAMEKAPDKEAVMQGIKLVQKEFHRVLEDNGVKRIETKGVQFDPNVHEAVMMVETEDYPDGAVMEEVRTGYLLNDRLLRPAQVKVAKNVKE